MLAEHSPPAARSSSHQNPPTTSNPLQQLQPKPNHHHFIHQSSTLIPHSLILPTVYAFNQQLPIMNQPSFFLPPTNNTPSIPLYPRIPPPSTPGIKPQASASSLHPHHPTPSRSYSNPTNTNNNHNSLYTHPRHPNHKIHRPLVHNHPPPSPRLSSPLSGSTTIPLPRPRTQSSQSDRSRPVSHHSSAPKSLNTNSFYALRTDPNQSTHSHGFPNGSSALLGKPTSSINPAQFTFNSSTRNPTTTTNTNTTTTTTTSTTTPTTTTNLSPSSIPPSPTIQGRPSSPSTHSFNPPPLGNMVRRSSPLAQSNTQPPLATDLLPQSNPTTTTTNSNSNSNTSYPSSASYRNSSASTVTITSAPPPTIPNSITLIPATQHDQEVEEDSDTTSDVDHRPPGHRSTPGTSVDSSTSNSTQPDDPSSLNRSSAFPDRAPHKHSKHSLSNKLRRALSINALHENMIHESIPELDPTIGHERLKSSSASIAGVPLSPSITTKVKAGRQPGTSRRFGFLNSRSNSSTDNLSISSTVSSASVMIRKLGNLGKSARTKGVMGLTKIFKDKSEAGPPGESAGDDGKGFGPKPDRFKKTASPNQHKNLASTSVAQVQAEVDRSLSVEFPGMTPAAAFIHKQKQQYAEQEAAAAAAAASAAEASNQSRGSESVRSKARAGSVGSLSSLTPGSASEARKKMIEKEKEKIKSKKSRKWGFAGLGGNGNVSEDLPALTSAEDLTRAPEHASDLEENEDWDENTVRDAKVEGDSDPPRKSIEELRGVDNNDEEEEDNEALDEYDMESLFGNHSSHEGSSTRRTGLRPRPSKEAVPKKGILKNAQHFSQEHHLSPASFQTKPISAATTPDSPKPRTLAEDRSLLPQLAKTNQTTVSSSIDFGTGVPNLSLTLVGTEGKDRRATFAQHLSVHTTWPPAIYDRRGELATCNRLTPTLAQRIKEEINAFKMEEMEVHHASR